MLVDTNEAGVSPEAKKAKEPFIWASFTAAETQCLIEDRWVNDAVISTILTHAAAAAPPSECLVITPYQLAQKEPGADSPVRSMLERALHANATDQNIVVVANLGNAHWVVIRLVLQPPSQANKDADTDSDSGSDIPQPKTLHRCELYDSIEPTSPGRLQEARDTAGRIIRDFLPQSYHASDTDWDSIMHCQPCPRQTNLADCGIYALVMAWHLLYHPRCLPTEINAPLWRAAFAALGNPDADQIMRYLPSTMTEDLEDGASSFAAAQQKEEQGSDNSFNDTSSLSFAQSRSLTAAAGKLSTAYRELASLFNYWERCEDEAVAVVQSTRYEIGPLVERWLNCMDAASDRAKNEISKLDAQGERLVGALSDLGTGEGQGIATHVQAAASSITKAMRLLRRIRMLVCLRLTALKEGKVRMLGLRRGLVRLREAMYERADTCRELKTGVSTVLKGPSDLGAMAEN